jgi:hypothetical protein
LLSHEATQPTFCTQCSVSCVGNGRATRPLPPMPVPITNLMRNQVAHYHCTTGGCVRLVSKADMCGAKGNVGAIKRTPRCVRQVSRPSSGWRPQHASTHRSQPG